MALDKMCQLKNQAHKNNDVIQGDNKSSTTHLEQSDNLNNSQAIH